MKSIEALSLRSTGLRGGNRQRYLRHCEVRRMRKRTGSTSSPEREDRGRRNRMKGNDEEGGKGRTAGRYFEDEGGER